MVEESNLTVQISALRRVLDRGRSEGSCIQTVVGRGYRLVATVTRRDAHGDPGTATSRERYTSAPVDRGAAFYRHKQ